MCSSDLAATAQEAIVLEQQLIESLGPGSNPWRPELRALAAEAVAEMETVFGQMEAAMGQSLAEELGPVPVSFARQAQLRFAGQRHYVQTGVAPGADLAQVRNAFESLYRQRFGHVDEGAPIEIVGLKPPPPEGSERFWCKKGK